MPRGGRRCTPPGINLANEKLQSHFNDHIFKLELVVYEQEGLDVRQAEAEATAAPCYHVCAVMLPHTPPISGRKRKQSWADKHAAAAEASPAAALQIARAPQGQGRAAGRGTPPAHSARLDAKA